MVFVSVIKTSEPPERLADLYWPGSATPTSPTSNRNFVPFHRSPSAENQAGLHWRNQQHHADVSPTDIQDELTTVHWRRPGLAVRPTTLSVQPKNQDLDLIESYPELGSGSEMPSHPRQSLSPTFATQLSSPGHTPDGKENTKRWSFGALFKRKEKGKSPAASNSAIPVPIQFDPAEQPPAVVGTLQSPDSESSPESEPRTNFLRRLSKKKKKPKTGDGSKPVEGFLKVPSHPVQHRRSIPEAVQSWETTKLAPPNLLNPGNAYSSSGSLSLSLEGSSSLSRGSRAAAKEAVKARAEARRESILIDTSSGEDGEDELEVIAGHGGSHSSLTGRQNRRTPARVSPATKTRGLQSSPHHQVSNSSPNIYGGGGGAEGPGRQQPRWEARIVYTQETLPEDAPVFVRLPKQRLSPHTRDSNGNRQFITTETASDDKDITAGLRLPANFSSSYPKTEPIYANLRRHNQPTENFGPPQTLRDVYYTPSPENRGHSRTPQNQNLTSHVYHPASYFFDDQRSSGDHGRSPVPKVGHHAYNQQHQWSNNNQFRSNTPTIYGNNNLQQGRWTPQQDYPYPSSTYDQQHEPRVRKHLASPLSMKNEEVNQNLPISKMGFPVRKLQQSSGEGSWPKSDRLGRSPHQQQSPTLQNLKRENSNFENFRREQSPLTRARIRSADSSPVPVPKHAKIYSPPPTEPTLSTPPIGMLRSNESISSLSSFSAETPSPNIFGSAKNNSAKIPSTKVHPGSAHHHRSRRIKSSEFKITTPTPSQSGESKSACERLNVKGYTPSPPPTLPSAKKVVPVQAEVAQPIAQEQKASSRKSPGKNLEDALNELEDMYKSLRLSDEDLLDRAERRDLPTPHQELREKDPVPYSTPRYFRFASSLGSGSLESVATTSGSGSTDGSRRRVRAPPLRRSGVPDRINDDMAKRKYDSRESSKVTDTREVMGQTGSYLAFSPAFSPPVSPCPEEQPPPSPSPYSSRKRIEPDVVVDDVAVRSIRDANAIRIIEEPQPLFGVPLGPITKAPPSDYLHATPKEKFRPLFRHVKNPDIVKDDQAFRNLRKDLSQENNLNRNWTPRLFSPQQTPGNGSSDSVFNYNIQPDLNAGAGSKKLRAVRSLSANISHIVNPPNPSSSLRQEIGKWNSYTDLAGQGQRSSRSLTPSRSSFRQASWVEQANLEEYGAPDTVYRPPSPKSTIKKKFKLLKPPVKPAPPPVDPNAPRRPWTDLILQSFEDHDEPKQAKVDHVAAVRTPVSEEDNDVFVDALPTTPSNSPPLDEREAQAPLHLAEIDDYFATFGLPPGQNQRPGSYADPRSSSLGPSQTEGPKRRSWSEVPKQFDSLQRAHEAIAGNSKPMVFHPLPTPRRIRQISLEGFSGGGSVQEHPSQSEQELNDLIDALVKDADNCGDDDVSAPVVSTNEPIPQVRKKRPSRPSQKETKWQAAIAELESPTPVTPPADPAKSWRRIDPSKSDDSEIASGLEHAKHIDVEAEAVHPQTFEQSAPRVWKKAPSEPPPTGPSGMDTKGSSQGHPRGILKNKGPSQGLSPIPSARIRGMTPKNGNNVKTGCGSTSNCMPSWQLRQNQSSLDTSNEIPSSTKTKIAEVKGGQLLSPLRHSNEGVTRASPANKITSSSPTVADPPKEKESPTIGGMSGLRRLLMRETSGNSAKKVTAKEEEATSSKGVKKSPSTGTLPSYWSRISSNQPSFLKRFFEKVNPSNPTSNSSLTNSESEDKPDPVMRSLIAPEPESEPILSMTVAQKATHFMKLEHKQRFSKWRNLDTNDNKIEPANRSVVGNDLGLPSPVKGQEFSPLSSPRSQLKLPDKFEHQFSPVEDKDRFKSAPIHRNTPKTKLNSLTANGMSSSEPSKLSLHDRVQMFNRLTSVPSIVRVKPIETEAVPAPRCRERSVESADACDQSRMPTYQYPFQKMRHPTHSRGSGSSSSLNYFNAPPLQQDTTRSYDKLATAYPLFRNHSTNAFPMTNGSTASIGSPYGNVPVSKPIPVIKKRITYVQSHSADNDLSEDGEVSSGGMEVAEIISKSYENSPMVQKKSWVAQKPQTSRGSRDVWRKHHVGLEDNISQWSTATDMPEVNSFQSQGSHFAKVTTGSKHGPKRQPETTTSNLLSLLTAMSSSDDQIDEPEPNPSRRYPPVTAKSRSMCSMVNQHHPVGLGLGRFKLVSGT